MQKAWKANSKNMFTFQEFDIMCERCGKRVKTWYDVSEERERERGFDMMRVMREIESKVINSFGER